MASRLGRVLALTHLDKLNLILRSSWHLHRVGADTTVQQNEILVDTTLEALQALRHHCRVTPDVPSRESGLGREFALRAARPSSGRGRLVPLGITTSFVRLSLSLERLIALFLFY